MLQIINLIKQRQELLADGVNTLNVGEKERIKNENMCLDTMYRYQRVSLDEKITFYQESLGLMGLPLQPVNSKLVYDAIAQLYINYFKDLNFEDKARKIQLILDNDMHKNQSFLILMLKWLLDYYRTIFSRRIQKPTLEPIERKRILTIDGNLKKVYNKRIRIYSLSKTPIEQEKTIAINTNNANTIIQKPIQSYKQCVQGAIPDLDWDNGKVGFQQLYSRNSKISRTLAKHYD